MKVWGALLLLFITFSCTKEVNIDIPGFKPELVVEGTIEAGGFPIVLLSQSASVYQETTFLEAYVNSFITSAEVKVVVDNDTIPLELFYIADLPIESQKKFAEMLRFDWPEIAMVPIQVYSSTTLQGIACKTYELLIDYNQKSYSAITLLPQPVGFAGLNFLPLEENQEYGVIKALLNDPIEANFYKCEYKRIQDFEGQPMDLLFKRSRRGYFRDRYFNGGTVDFDFSSNLKRRDSTHLKKFEDYFRKGHLVVFKLSTMDKNVYDFFRRKRTQLDNNNSPFSSPVNLVSNVKGGALGVWAGYTPTYDTVYCQ
jgi:hypothetical protein